MKNLQFLKWIACVAMIAGVLVSCRKGKEALAEEYPVVKIISAEYDPAQASVTITAEIVSTGDGDIQGVGFRLSDRADFLMNRNEELAEVVDSKFTITYYHYINSQHNTDIFSGEKTVYFYAFAVNDKGFGVSELQQMGPFEVSQLDVPCELDLDIANLGTFEYNVANARQYQDYNEMGDLNSRFYINVGSTEFVFLFNKIAAPGTYTTTLNNGSADLFEVRIYDDDFNAIAAGQTLYIEQYDDEHLLVSLCESPIETGTNTTFSTSFLIEMDN